MFVNILLKDGVYLKKAAIFDNLKEICYIDNYNEINNKFKSSDFIYFQTSTLNGKFYPSNVHWYEIITLLKGGKRVD